MLAVNLSDEDIQDLVDSMCLDKQSISIAEYMFWEGYQISLDGLDKEEAYSFCNTVKKIISNNLAESK